MLVPNGAGRPGDQGTSPVEAVALAAVPSVLVAGALFDGPWALLLAAVVVGCLVLVLSSWERSVPPLSEIVPATTLAAVACAGRVLFAAVPDVKPVSAVVVVAGASLGRRTGFLTGALAALVSNLFFGQGPWTPWQMYGWGLMGYVAGVLADRGVLRSRASAAIYGFGASIAYGVLLDGYSFVSFVRPPTVAGALATWAASLPFDLVHALATVAFLLAVWEPWNRALRRVGERYGDR